MNLKQRLGRLEQSSNAEVSYVAVRINGVLHPRKPSQKLGRGVAVLPEVCKTTEEWLAQLDPELIAGSRQ